MATLTKSHGSTRAERLVARVTHEDKVIIGKAAAFTGQSIGSFVVAQARKAAIKTLEAYEHSECIVLNAEQSRHLIEVLLAPPRPPTKHMIEAMRDYRATVKSDLD